MGISAVSATFFCSFPDFWAGFEVLFWEFLRFQLLFSALFRIFGWVWGAVLGISAVSATFFCFFPAFLAGFGVLFWEFMRFQLLFARSFPAVGLNFGCCFRSFRDYSYPRPACYAINLWLLYIMLI